MGAEAGVRRVRRVRICQGGQGRGRSRGAKGARRVLVLAATNRPTMRIRMGGTRGRGRRVWVTQHKSPSPPLRSHPLQSTLLKHKDHTHTQTSTRTRTRQQPTTSSPSPPRRSCKTTSRSHGTTCARTSCSSCTRPGASSRCRAR
jgi:hypothetical protein